MKISIIGGGYVGLVTGTCFAELGHRVSIINRDKNRTDAINAGETIIFEPGLDELIQRNVGNGLWAYSDYTPIANSELSFICVGTPAREDGGADLTMIISAIRSIGEILRNQTHDHVVVVKSTVPPGTTENIVLPILTKSADRSDIGISMNPEFLREGRAIEDFMHPDRIVIGCSNSAICKKVSAAYEKIKAPILHTSISSAEMIKYASNSFLATKISFSNEIGNICKKLGIDVYEVMKGVGMDHRISPHFLNAGVGFGGSCFPKDVSALIHLAESLDEKPDLLQAVMRVNDKQPHKLITILEKRIGDLLGKKIAVLGLAFKDNTDDIRDSRAIPVLDELLKRGAIVSAYDPQANQAMEKMFPEIGYFNQAIQALENADACLVLTEWPEFDKLNKEFEVMRSRVIIEGRRILTGVEKEGICW